MATASLTGAHLLRNDGDDVSRLAKLFQLLFEYYVLHSSPAAWELIDSLRTLAGLGFTAALGDEISTVCYQPYLNSFLKHDRGNFKKYSSSLGLLSKDMSNMVMLGVSSFRLHYEPPYYQCFMRTIRDILNDMIIAEAGQTTEAKQVLELLQHRRE